MNKIRDRLYLGSWNSVNPKDLKANGITAILSCDHNLIPDLHSIREQYKWQCVHLHDLALPNPSFVLTLAAKVVEMLIQGGETVLVHCHAGANRSPTVVAKYLMLTEGKTFDERWAELRTVRHQVSSESSVMKYLLP